MHRNDPGRPLPAARARPWACTRAQVRWIVEGFASQALHCLLCAYGVFARDRHRALADCEAGVWLLALRLPVSGDSVLAAMRRRALTETACACSDRHLHAPCHAMTLFS